MLFLLAVHHNVDNNGEYSVALPAGVRPEDVYTALASFNEYLQTTSSWVFAGGLQPLPAGTTIDVDDSGPHVVDDSRTAPPEALGGFWVIDVTDRDSAMMWAQRASMACHQPVQVRPFQERAAA